MYMYFDYEIITILTFYSKILKSVPYTINMASFKSAINSYLLNQSWIYTTIYNINISSLTTMWS